ncbi:MAG: AMP-binding protein, partial [Dehalococcoidia bacterium]|nr:AMP-binding protein [Dehalococcoidia bacterium]
QAKHWIDRLALSFLEMGMGKDEVVVIQLPNTVELCLARVACEKAGLVFLPILRSYRHQEVKQFLSMTRAAAIIIPWRFRGFDYFKMIQDIRPHLPDLRHVLVVGDEVPEGALSVERIVRSEPVNRDGASQLERTRCPATEFSMILPTSGTTGFPRLGENPIMVIMVREKACVKNLKLTADDVVGIFSPAAGGSNGRGYYAAPLVAAKIVMLERWEPDKALQLIQKERVTVVPLVPTQLIQILNYPGLDTYDLSSLRVIVCMGAALPFHIVEKAEKKLVNCRIIQQYSSVGCSIGCTVLLNDDRQTRLFTVGKPYGGAQLKLVDENGEEVPKGEVGEIMLKGPGGDSGYYKDPEATRQAWTGDGWFRMGDLGKLDQRGNLIIVGRKKDVIIRGGQNIFPAEIENLLLTHPAVSEAAVIGVPDSIMGERACACFVLKPGTGFTREEMISFLSGKEIASYKIPEQIKILEALPKVADGQKVDKKALGEAIIGSE